jgi:hypothetical protein
MKKEITPGAPKIKFLTPKVKPPSLILNHEQKLEEEKEFILIGMDEINKKINEKIMSENENKNTLKYISEYYKDRLNLINSSIKFKLSLYQKRNSSISLETKYSEKELLAF